MVSLHGYGCIKLLYFRYGDQARFNYYDRLVEIEFQIKHFVKRAP